MPAPRDSESGVPLQIYVMIKLLSSSSSSSSLVAPEDVGPAETEAVIFFLVVILARTPNIYVFFCVYM